MLEALRVLRIIWRALSALVVEHFLQDYSRQLIVDHKLLKYKLTGHQRQVVLEMSPIFLHFDLVNGKVTEECDKLGLGVTSVKQKSQRPSMLV